MRKFFWIKCTQALEGARVKHGNLRGVEFLIDSIAEDTEIGNAANLDSVVLAPIPIAIDDDMCILHNN